MQPPVWRRAVAAVRGLALVVAVVLFCGIAGTRVHAAPVVYDSSESIHDSSDTPPPDAAAWTAQTFPDSWNITRRGLGGTVWYRFDFRIVSPVGAYAIYLPRVSMNAAVYVNGLLVGSGGSFNEPVARNWNRPLFFLIPPGVLKEGTNRIHVRVRGYPDLDGGLSAPVIDSDAALTDDYEQALFWRIILAQTTSLLIVAVGIFMLMLWIRRRQDAAFGYFGFASLLWAFYTSDLYVRDIPVPTFYWELAIRSSFHGFALLLALFALDYATDRSPLMKRVRIGLWTMMALVPISFLVGESTSLFLLSGFWNVVTFVVAASASQVALREALRRRSWQAVSLIVIGLLTIAFALHDVLIKGGWLADDRMNLLMFAAVPRNRVDAHRPVHPDIVRGRDAESRARSARGGKERGAGSQLFAARAGGKTACAGRGAPAPDARHARRRRRAVDHGARGARRRQVRPCRRGPDRPRMHRRPAAGHRFDGTGR